MKTNSHTELEALEALVDRLTRRAEDVNNYIICDKCRFSRLWKYFVFLSPSLYHFIFHLKIDPWVL